MSARRAGPAGRAASPTSIEVAVQQLEQGRWEAAHAIVQSESGALACWAHGIVHLVEGDLDNARYWYGRASRPWPAAPAADAELAALREVLSERQS
ncbi:MAG: hypothetical protein ABIS17_06255 [Casimicrobiaceae bacterium]